MIAADPVPPDEAGDRPAAPPRGRWGALDATRGAAMGLVFLSHFGLTWFGPDSTAPVARAVTTITLVASPTFVLVSGVLLGWLAASRPESLPALRRKLLDRGVFLLVFARILILVAHVPLAGGLAQAARWGFMTDAIGVCMIAGPAILARTGARTRVALGASMLAAGWAAAVSPWAPAGPAQWLWEALFGALTLHRFAYVFPLVPWLGVYLAATALGERLRGRAGDAAGLAAGCARAGVALATAGAAALGLHLLARLAGLPASAPLRALTGVAQKLPPGPAYLGVHGGAGLLLLAGLSKLERRGLAPTPRRLAELLGRSSLFAFVLQYFVFYTGLVLLRRSLSAGWPLTLAACLAAIVAAVTLWDRAGLNRVLTAGLRPRAPRAAPASTPDLPA
jgi:hypothetical protein